MSSQSDPPPPPGKAKKTMTSVDAKDRKLDGELLEKIVTELGKLTAATAFVINGMDTFINDPNSKDWKVSSLPALVRYQLAVLSVVCDGPRSPRYGALLAYRLRNKYKQMKRRGRPSCRGLRWFELADQLFDTTAVTTVLPPSSRELMARVLTTLEGVSSVTHQLDFHGAASECHLTPAHIQQLWEVMCQVTFQKLQDLTFSGDDPARSARMSVLEWRCAELALLTTPFNIVTEECVVGTLPSRGTTSNTFAYRMAGPLRALTVLLRLVEEHGVEDQSDRTCRNEAWMLLHQHYCNLNLVSSLAVLQRRWFELCAGTRRAISCYLSQPKKANAPHHIYRALAKRFPAVLTTSRPSWRQMVQSGDVLRRMPPERHLLNEDCTDVDADTEDVQLKWDQIADYLRDESNEDHVEEAESEDDIILVERAIETIDLETDEEEQAAPSSVTFPPLSAKEVERRSMLAARAQHMCDSIQNDLRNQLHAISQRNHQADTNDNNPHNDTVTIDDDHLTGTIDTQNDALDLNDDYSDDEGGLFLDCPEPSADDNTVYYLDDNTTIVRNNAEKNIPRNNSSVTNTDSRVKNNIILSKLLSKASVNPNVTTKNSYAELAKNCHVEYDKEQEKREKNKEKTERIDRISISEIIDKIMIERSCQNAIKNKNVTNTNTCTKTTELDDPANLYEPSDKQFNNKQNVFDNNKLMRENKRVDKCVTEIPVNGPVKSAMEVLEMLCLNK